jgi:hypothetical protein
MARKNEPTSQRTPTITCRASDHREHAMFERIAAREQFASIPQWLLELARQRAKKVDAALESGAYVVINDRPYPADEVPGAEQIRCMLRNAETLLNTKASQPPEQLKRITKWLCYCVIHGNTKEQEEAIALATHLPRNHFSVWKNAPLVGEAIKRFDEEVRLKPKRSGNS